METQQQNESLLEPIEEESEHEDKTVGGRAGDLKLQVGVETEEALAENYKEEEEDDVPLRVLRPGQRSGSICQKRLSQISSDCSWRETENSQVINLGGESAQGQKLGDEKKFTEKLRKKASRVRWVKQTPPKPSRRKKRKLGVNTKVEAFPDWVVNLMVNIEEATTHQLLVE